MPPLFISAYTVGNGYEVEAAELLKTLDAMHLPSEVVPFADQGSWQQNTQAKATFIRSRMVRYPGRPLVWLDADSRVRQYPAAFDELTCDFSAHWRVDPVNYPDHGELLSGVLYFAGNRASVQLVDSWIHECKLHPNVWDQKCLDAAVQYWLKAETLTVTNLPASYCLIFDSMAHLGPPVIEQMQASRRLRKE